MNQDKILQYIRLDERNHVEKSLLYQLTLRGVHNE